MWLSTLKTTLDMLYKLAAIVAVVFGIWVFVYTVQPMLAVERDLNIKTAALNALTLEATAQQQKADAAKAKAAELHDNVEQLRNEAKQLSASVIALQNQVLEFTAKNVEAQAQQALVQQQLAAVNDELNKAKDNLFALNVKRFSDKVFQQYLAKMNDPGFSVIDYSRTVLNSDIFANEPMRAELKKYLGAYINQYQNIQSNDVPGFVAGMQFKYVLEKLQKEKAAAMQKQL